MSDIVADLTARFNRLGGPERENLRHHAARGTEIACGRGEGRRFTVRRQGPRGGNPRTVN